jgi:hypothetical protein
MHTTQTTLTDDPDDPDDPADTATTEHESSSNAQMYLAPPDQRGGDGCCPWCLSAPETFEYGDGRPRCGFCDSAIPTETEWYQRGEKIVV